MGNISAEHRARRVRPGLATALLAALLAALMAAVLAGCGGGGGGAEAPPPVTPPEARAVALAVSRPGELASYVQARLRQRSAATGAPDLAAVPAVGSAPPPASTTLRSGTTLQEQGVDEPDLLQARDDALFALSTRAPADGGAARAVVQAWRRSAQGEAVRAAGVTLPADDQAFSIQPAGMVMAEDGRTLAVLNQLWRAGSAGVICADLCPLSSPALTSPALVWTRSAVEIQRVDAGDAGALKAGARLSLDGQLVAARRVGDTLVVVSTWRPQLPVDMLPAGASAAEREAAIARTTAADVLPKMRRNGGAAEALLRDTDCWTQPGNGSTDVQVTTLTLLDLRAADLAPKSRCFVGGTQAVYMTPTSLYLATTRWTLPTGGGLVALPAGVRTDIHKFALDATGPVYRASGEVAGHLGWDPAYASYRFSEWNGDLRVLSYTGSQGWSVVPETATPASPAQLTVLRERAADATLQAVATLPNAQRPAALGKPGEQVRAVRFVGPRGYLVTFRRIDPLYVLDLANPLDPVAAGVLEVPGFSDQLLPLSDGLLLGVGREVDAASGRVAGIKVALFDVQDATRPLERASVVLGQLGSSSALDASPHGINARVAGGVARVALPVALAGPDFSAWQRQLQRFEVDLAARTLRPLAALHTVSENPWAVQNERSLQFEDRLYHLRDGEILSAAWSAP